MPAATETAEVTVYVIVCPDAADGAGADPEVAAIVGVPARPAPETAKVIDLIVPAVAVVNE